MENEEKVKKPKSKARKIIEWIGTAILGVIFVFAAVCNMANLLSRNEYGYGSSFGYSSYIVLTDSMEPTYKVNSSIITYKEKPEEILKQWNEIKDLNLEMTDERNINLTFVDAYTMRIKPTNPVYTNQTTEEPDGKPPVMTHQLFEIRVDESIPEGQGRYTFFVHGINIEGHLAGANQYQVFTETELLGVVKMNSSFIGGISNFLSSVWGLLICLLIPCLYMVISSMLDVIKAFKYEEDTPEEGENENKDTISSLSDSEYEKLKSEMIDEMINGKGDKK